MTKKQVRVTYRSGKGTDSKKSKETRPLSDIPRRYHLEIDQDADTENEIDGVKYSSAISEEDRPEEKARRYYQEAASEGRPNAFTTIFGGRASLVLMLFIGTSLFWAGMVTLVGGWGATWFGVWTLIPGVIANMLILGFLWYKWDMFTPDKRHPIPTWMHITMAAYFVVAMFFGLFFTEAMFNGGVPRSALAQHGQSSDDQNYQYSRSGGFVYTYIFVSSTSRSGSVAAAPTMPTITKDEAKVLPYIILAAILLMYIIGSAFVAHFWITACLLAVMFFGLAFMREYREGP